MFRRKPLSVAVQQAFSTVAIAATAAAPSVALGQDRLEEVVVTGSRIAGDANLVTSSPVTQLKAEEIGYRGITRVEDLLNDMPQIVPDLTANESNGATGTATIDLRGLGADRTLVLTNGHRMGFGDPLYMPPDINTVPGALIERVEILTGGASSTYGSDAVSGVVNFIMKDDFEGVQIDYQYSANWHNSGNPAGVQEAIDAEGFPQAPDNVWDGGTHDINVIFGVNSPDGRGNITGYLGYRDVNAVTQSERDFSACALSSSNGVTCQGSATSPTGLFSPFDTYAYYTVDGTDFVAGVPYYNYGPLNYFQRPDERYTAGMFAHYEVNEHFEPYAEFQFMDDRSLAQIAPSGAFFVTSTLSCDNPFLSAQQAATINALDNYDNAVGPFDANGDPTLPDGMADYPCVPGAGDEVPFYIGRRNVEGGPRFDDLRHTTYRILGGVRGNINDDWTYDASVNFNRLVYAETYQNDMSITRIGRALDVVDVGGVPTCQSVVDGSDPNCVPWNIFEEGAVTQDAIDYLTLPLFSDARLKQDQYVAFVTGDLTSAGVISPMASDGVKVVLGSEYRDETIDYNVDQGFQSGDGAGQGGATVSIDGGLSVWEFFFETKIPLVQDREWIESLTLDAGYRYSDYSTGINTDTWKAIGEWTPTQGFKLRGGYSRAVRHGNLIELFEPQNAGLWSEGGDPCAGPLTNGLTEDGLNAAQCALTGVPAGSHGGVPSSPAGQYNGVFGGNPDLDPEKANSFTIGAVFTPDQYVPGLQFSVDYWHIEVKDAIANVEPFTIINACANSGDPLLCGLIHRSPANGNLWVGNVNAGAGTGNYVETTNVNVGFFETGGIDFIGAYTHEVGNYGNLDFAFRGTYVTKWDQQEIPGGIIDDCAGNWGGACARPTPEWKHNFTSIWTTPWDLVFVGTWRMIGSVDELSDNANAYDASTQHYFDLTAEYTPQFIGIGETKFTVGVTNLLDNDPPVNGRFGNVAVYGNGNTIPGTWDTMGRYMFFGVSQKF